MGLGAYLGVPVVLSDGRLYGTLCAASREAQPHLSARDVDFLRVAASLVAEQLEQHIEQEVPRRLAREQTLAAVAGEGSRPSTSPSSRSRPDGSGAWRR